MDTGITTNSILLSGLTGTGSLAVSMTTNSALDTDLIIQGRIYCDTRDIKEDWGSYSDGAFVDDSNWTQIRGSFYINKHRIRGDSAYFRSCIVRSGTFPNNQYSEVSFIGDGDDAGSIGAAVRCSTGPTFYGFYINGTGTLLRVFKYVAGSYTSLYFDYPSFDLSTGDILRLSVVGTRLSFTVNGVAYPDIPDIIDTDISSGNPGLTSYRAYETYCDNWNWGIPQTYGTLTDANTNGYIQVNLNTSSTLSGDILGKYKINILSGVNTSTLLISSMKGRGIINFDSIYCSSTLEANLSAESSLSSLISTSSLLVGTLKVKFGLVSSINSTSILSGLLISTYSLYTTVQGSTELFGTLVGIASIGSSIGSSSTLSCDISSLFVGSIRGKISSNTNFTALIKASAKMYVNSIQYSIVSTNLKGKGKLISIFDTSSSIGSKLVSSGIVLLPTGSFTITGPIIFEVSNGSYEFIIIK